MNKFAGIDLNRLNLDKLSWSEIDTIYNAFTSSYEHFFGSIDFTTTDTVIKHISRYLRMSVVEVEATYCFEDSVGLSESDLRMALAVRMLPNDSRDPLIIQTRDVLNQHVNIEELTAIQDKSFRLADLLVTWNIIKDCKLHLNFTGFWDKSARDLAYAVSEQHLSLAKQQIVELAQQPQIYTTDIALQIIMQIKLLRYLHYRIHKPDYRIVVGRYEDEFGLKAMEQQVYAQLLGNLQVLRQRVNRNEYETTSHQYRTLLFRKGSAARVHPEERVIFKQNVCRSLR